MTRFCSCGEEFVSGDDDEIIAPDSLPEILDLIAEAPRTSPHAKRAYELLREAFPEDVPILAQTQRLIEGRMGGLPC